MIAHYSQIIHPESSLGKRKCDSAVATLKAMNSSVQFKAIDARLTAENALAIISSFDLVLDCTDNITARYLINDACIIANKPLVSGSAVGLEGQMTVFLPHETACYRCLHPQPSLAEACRSCSDAGVLGPVPGLIGCIMATEAMKVILTGQFSSSSGTANADSSNTKNRQLDIIKGRQVYYDAAMGEFHTFTLPPRSSSCAVCGDSPTITSLADTDLFLQQFHTKITSAAEEYKGNLPIENEFDVERFQLLLSQQPPQPDHITLIVDVRPAFQFSLCRLIHDNIAQYTEHKLRSKRVILINLPLAELKSQVGCDKLRQVCNELQSQQQQAESTVLNTLLLCRRGIDSTVATRHLLEQGWNKDTVFNITGGLTAWKTKIDTTFLLF